MSSDQNYMPGMHGSKRQQSKGQQHRHHMWRAVVVAFSCAAYFLYDMHKNLPPTIIATTTPVFSSLTVVNELMEKKQKFLLNCAAFHSNYSNTGNFAHVPSSITGGSEFNMSVHDPEKEIISMKIKKDGCFECDILRPLISALKKSKDASLIDMGGNIGMYSLHAASHGRNAVAFEPLQINQEKLCQSTLLSPDFGEKIQIVPRALTNENNSTYVDFNTEWFNKAVLKRKRGQKNYGTMITGAGLDKKPPGILGKDYALATTIDSIKDLHILPPSGSNVVLKVDVEGSECRALAGAAEYLLTVNIEYVALEMSQDRIEQCRVDGVWDNIYNLFLDNGLGPYMFDEKAKGWVKIHDWQDLNVTGMTDIAFSAGPPSNL